MFSCVSFTRRNTKESRKGSGTANTSGRSNNADCEASQQQQCNVFERKKVNREIFTSFEHVHSLQVGGHPLQRHSFQVGLSVAVVPVCGRSRQSSISSPTVAALFCCTHSLAKANSSGESNDGSPACRDFSFSNTCGKNFSIWINGRQTPSAVFKSQDRVALLTFCRRERR